MVESKNKLTMQNPITKLKISPTCKKAYFLHTRINKTTISLTMSYVTLSSFCTFHYSIIVTIYRYPTMSYIHINGEITTLFFPMCKNSTFLQKKSNSENIYSGNKKVERFNYGYV